jgi:dTDP-4-amino-4,6-dideoxy-D-galactose acyltransferase
MIEFKHLEWDSNFFGFPIGKITLSNEFSLPSFTDFLAEKKKENFQLFYVFSDKNVLDNDFLEKNNGVLIDKKVVFRYKNNSTEAIQLPSTILRYDSTVLDANLLELALQSGHYSRFYLDKKFPTGSFEKLYTLWIKNSIDGSFADDIFIWKENEQIEGMVTVKYQADTATIGLIAVDTAVRGKNIGSHLLNAVKNASHSKSIPYIDVATQIDNELACKFYQKNHFDTKTIDYIYHIWTN